MQTFEDRLLTELKTLVAERAPAPAPHRRARVLVLAGAVAAGAVAAALVVPSLFASAPANAVVRDPDGSLRLYIRDYRHPEVLERKIANAGVPALVDFVPNGMRCDRPGPPVAAENGELTEPGADADDELYVRVFPAAISSGATLVIEVAYEEHGESTASTLKAGLVAKGTPQHCRLVPGPARFSLGPDGEYSVQAP